MDITWLAEAAQPCLLHHPFQTIPIAGKVEALFLQCQAKGLIALILDRATAMLVIPMAVDGEQRPHFAHRDWCHQLPQPLKQHVLRDGRELMARFL